MAITFNPRVMAVLVSALGVLISTAAFAAPPVPLTVQPISTRIQIGSVCSPTGVSNASLSSSVIGNPPGMTGLLQVDGSLLPTEVIVNFSGTGSGVAGEVYFRVFFEVEAQIPEIGDAMTPAFVSLEQLTVSGPSWSVRSVYSDGHRLPVCSPYSNDGEAPDSEIFGSRLGNKDTYGSYQPDVEAWSERTTNPLFLLAGDTVRIPIAVGVALYYSGSPGSFSNSVRFALRIAPTTIGNGDVNGDAQVNVLDTTLIRRAIAGFPNP